MCALDVGIVELAGGVEAGGKMADNINKRQSTAWTVGGGWGCHGKGKKGHRDK